MNRFALLLVSIAFGISPLAAEDKTLPPGFVDLSQAVPGIVLDIRYTGPHNFVGVPIDGYVRPRALLTHLAAAALAKAQEDLAPFGFGLKVFDAYRPQRAVDHFVRWSHDAAALTGKAEFYPQVDKSKLFELGYIAEKSGHSRGSTVDLTIVVLADGSELAMGSPYDLFDPISWPDSAKVSPEERAHRLLLREVMLRAGFKPYAQEWWHFTLEGEPFPETYFDFPVE
ncbi:MAG: M15 family metallopeptidase [Acidobacteriota bacterium]